MNIDTNHESSSIKKKFAWRLLTELSSHSTLSNVGFRDVVSIFLVDMKS